MKKNVLIFGFLQLLVGMPMALLSSGEQEAARLKQKEAREKVDERIKDFAEARAKEGVNTCNKHMKERVREAGAAAEAIGEYNNARKVFFDCRMKSVMHDPKLTEEKKSEKKKELLRKKLRTNIAEKRTRR